MPFDFRILAIKRNLFCTLLGVLAWLPLSACLDIDFDAGLSASPEANSQTVRPGEAYFGKGKSYYTEQLAHWKAAWEEDGKWRDQVRYAVCLALLREYDEALTHLNTVEAEYPGKYIVALNLATVYEQKKEYKLALQWMEKAIAIDPEGHFGSEWIHLNILKVEAAGRQQRCTAQQLIEQDFGTDSMPASTLDDPDLGELASHIFYQLNQRVWLQTKPDPCAAHLAFALGNINFLRRFPTVSLLDYELAQEKGLQDPLLEIRMTAVMGGTYKAPPPSAEQQMLDKQMRHWEEQAKRKAEEVDRGLAEEEAQVENERQANRIRGAIGMVVLFLILAGGLGALFWYGYNSKTRQNKLKSDNFHDFFDQHDQ
jgi:tetratricopeptide (TPR) repeat protein